MWWRLSRTEFEAGKGEPNRQAMKRLVKSGAEPGLIAYLGTEPVGWCAVAPRADYRRLQSSRSLKPIDDEPVWSVSCLFIAKKYRGNGVSIELLKAAIDHVRKNGGCIVEGYPHEPAKGRMPDVFAWTGLASAFRKAGFTEAARPTTTRRIMRFQVNANLR
jgi:GNAT superfamily N-acetyltransferase